jgi:Cu-Zn family superoxide dismutase
VQRLATATLLAAGVTLLAACASSGNSSGTSSPVAAAGTTVQISSGTVAETSASGAASSGGTSAAGSNTGTEVARAELNKPDGSAAGTVTFSTPTDAPETLVVRVSATGLQPGFKGFHVHTIGKCEPNSPDPANPANVGNFLSAGGHLKAPGENHAGHDGDMTSLQVGSDGTAELVTSTDVLPVDVLLDADGSAVMVHLGPDNFGNIPTRYAPTPDADTLNTGDSGGRGACGVVEAG